MSNWEVAIVLTCCGLSGPGIGSTQPLGSAQHQAQQQGEQLGGGEGQPHPGDAKQVGEEEGEGHNGHHTPAQDQDGGL